MLPQSTNCWVAAVGSRSDSAPRAARQSGTFDVREARAEYELAHGLTFDEVMRESELDPADVVEAAGILCAQIELHAGEVLRSECSRYPAAISAILVALSEGA